MIGWLSGRVLGLEPGGEVLVDVGGVGYRVNVAVPAAAGLPEIGGSVTFHVHTHVREDALILYGFGSMAERRCFELLLGAHGVGPALALAMVGMLGPEGLARGVVEEDLDALCAVPGVGRKTAARLVLDLKAKMGVFLSADGLAAGGPVGGRSGPAEVAGVGSTARSNARSALVELGYTSDEVHEALLAVAEDATVNEQLRQALQNLAGKASTGRRTRQGEQVGSR